MTKRLGCPFIFLGGLLPLARAWQVVTYTRSAFFRGVTRSGSHYQCGNRNLKWSCSVTWVMRSSVPLVARKIAKGCHTSLWSSHEFRIARGLKKAPVPCHGRRGLYTPTGQNEYIIYSEWAICSCRYLTNEVTEVLVYLHQSHHAKVPLTCPPHSERYDSPRENQWIVQRFSIFTGFDLNKEKSCFQDQYSLNACIRDDTFVHVSIAFCQSSNCRVFTIAMVVYMVSLPMGLSDSPNKQNRVHGLDEFSHAQHGSSFAPRWRNWNSYLGASAT